MHQQFLKLQSPTLTGNQNWKPWAMVHSFSATPGKSSLTTFSHSYSFSRSIILDAKAIFQSSPKKKAWLCTELTLFSWGVLHVCLMLMWTQLSQSGSFGARTTCLCPGVHEFCNCVFANSFWRKLVQQPSRHKGDFHQLVPDPRPAGISFRPFMRLLKNQMFKWRIHIHVPYSSCHEHIQTNSNTCPIQRQDNGFPWTRWCWPEFCSLRKSLSLHSFWCPNPAPQREVTQKRSSSSNWICTCLTTYRHLVTVPLEPSWLVCWWYWMSANTGRTPPDLFPRSLVQSLMLVPK